MQVFLIRHAKAVPAIGKMRDDDRHLADDGRESARQVGARLAELGVRPSVVYTSPLVRAVQTAELVSIALAPLRVVAHVPLSIDHGTVAQALSVLERHAEKDVIVLVTHEPKVRSIAASLSGRNDFPSFPTAGVAAFQGNPKAMRFAYRLDPSTLVVDEATPHGD